VGGWEKGNHNVEIFMEGFADETVLIQSGLIARLRIKGLSFSNSNKSHSG
jgi:hypothetical protein